MHTEPTRKHRASMPSVIARFMSSTRARIKVCRLAPSGADLSEVSTVKSNRVVKVFLGNNWFLLEKHIYRFTKTFYNAALNGKLCFTFPANVSKLSAAKVLMGVHNVRSS